jgi:hypothetical protein
MHKYGRLKPVQVILRRRREKRKNDERNVPNQGTLYAYMDMSKL